jgi:pyrroloquinoline quinone biosynthesis protein E
LALTGDAANTDPACSLSPFHARIGELAAAESENAEPTPYRYRVIGGATPAAVA